MILVSEVEYEIERIFRTFREAKEKGRESATIVTAEGIGDTRQLADELEKATGAEVRLTALGYTQRGGNPSARSGLLANLFAEKALELSSAGQGSQVIALQGGEITSISLEQRVGWRNHLN